MKSKRIRLLFAGATAWISFMCFMTPTQGANIVIGGNTTDIGTIIFVSPKPGDTPADAGLALRTTLVEITDNSADNPYLIKIGPGIYDLGTSSLQMKQYVDIEGSGENVTKITGVASSAVSMTQPNPTVGTVNGANNAEIRFLTVENAYQCYSGCGSPVAFYNSSASPTMTHLTINAVTTTQGQSTFGVYNSSSSPSMTNVTVTAGSANNCCGVYNGESSPTMTNVKVSASGAEFITGVSNYGPSSPTMTNVTVSASGADNAIGVSNSSSSPMMTNVTVSASGATFITGIQNTSYIIVGTPTMTMTNVTATASGASYSYGMFNDSTSTGSYYTLNIDRSTFSGGTNSIYNNSRFTLQIGASKLTGAVYAVGTYFCVNSYRGENYTPLNASCQ